MQPFCFKFLGLILVFTSLSQGKERIELKSEMTSAPAGAFSYVFQLIDAKTKKPITDKNLNLSHEKKIHLILFDPGLQVFQHVHPVFSSDKWRADINLTVSGKYFVYAQGEIAKDEFEFTAKARIEIQNGTSANTIAKKLGDVRTGSDGNSVAKLGTEMISVNKMIMLNLEFSHKDKSAITVPPYLGAFAHIVATPLDGSSLLHVHPVSGDQPNKGVVHAEFPKKGDYRLWIQFNDGDQLKVIPLSISVK